MCAIPLANLRGPDLKELVARYKKNLNSLAREYLHGRGVSDEAIDQTDIGMGGSGSRIGFETRGEPEEFFENNIVFPLRSTSGEVMDLLGLPLGEEDAQMKTLSGRADGLFMAGDVAGSEMAFLCESPFDALMLYQLSIPAVAVLGGSNLAESVVEMFRDKNVFISFHSDLAGRKNTYRAMDLIAPVAREVFHLSLPPGLRSLNELFLSLENPVETVNALIHQARREGRYRRFSPDALRLPVFLQEFEHRRSGELSGLPTGLPTLDRVLLGGLREGLYLVAGYPGAGKTTLLRQFAENIAAQQHPVLYFSLEMSAFELWAKGISRLLGCRTGEVLAGTADAAAVERANQEYQKIAESIWTIEGGQALTLGAMAEYTRQTYNQLGKAPVVMVDYLERIAIEAPSGVLAGQLNALRASALKQLSLGFNCPVVVASSLDQATHSSDAWSAFAGKGEIDHTADVVIVLNLGSGPEDWEGYKTECARDPGRVLVDVMKNRNGQTAEIPLTFYKSQGRFTEE